MFPSKGKCQLCHNEVHLVRSHIIPEFMYKCSGLYGEKRQFAVIRHVDKETPSLRLRQIGLRERLLGEECKCEDKLSKWEHYARRVIYVPSSRRPAKLIRPRLALYNGVDYRIFKLFLMSLLWRMSISSLDHFDKVSLGPHEERVGRMLLEEDPGDEDDYGCMIITVISDSTDLTQDTILRRFGLGPGRVRVHGGICYWMVLGGVVYIFVVSKHNIPADVRRLFLNRSNQLPVLVQKSSEVPFVIKGLSKLAEYAEQWISERG